MKMNAKKEEESMYVRFSEFICSLNGLGIYATLSHSCTGTHIEMGFGHRPTDSDSLELRIGMDCTAIAQRIVESSQHSTIRCIPIPQLIHEKKSE